MDMESKREFVLSEPITRSEAGQMVPVQVVDVVAPPKKLMRKTYRLQQHTARALLVSQQVLKDLAGDREPSESKDLEASDVLALFLASDVDIETCLSEFDKLALAGCIEIDGTPINSIQWGKICDDDKEALFAEFIANFIMSSVLRIFAGNSTK